MAALVLALVASYVSALNVSVAVSPSLPPHAQPLSQTLVSFSIEQDRWPDWTGTDAQNNFTHTALSNYAALTGKPPDIRVGANSVDHSFWSPTETLNADVFPTPNAITPYPEATHIVVGNDFYKLSRHLPQGTHMVWGVNLGANNATNAVNMAKAIATSFADPAVQSAGVVLDRIEVGNEPDLYAHNGLRPRNYTLQQYVAEWETSAAAVVQAMGMGSKGSHVKIQGGAFADQGFTPREIFNLGILGSAGGKVMSTYVRLSYLSLYVHCVCGCCGIAPTTLEGCAADARVGARMSQHHYSGHYCRGGTHPLASFLSKSAIRGNLTMFQQDISATQSHGLTYILGCVHPRERILSNFRGW